MIIDVDALRDYLEDYAGSAAFSGFPGAMADLVDMQGMGPEELIRKAERMGIDPADFAVADGFEDDEDDEEGESPYGW